MRTVKLDDTTKKNLLDTLLKRSPGNYGEYNDTVTEIVERVRTEGDQALFELTRKFDWDGIGAANVQVTEEEFREAYEKIDKRLLETIRKSLKNIREYHEKQRQYSWFDSTPEGTILGQKVTPLRAAGVYVPGGKAVYPSSVLMNIVPAKIAGVSQVIMATPCGKDGRVNPSVLVAAKESGADAVYKIGGAQAIAAMAFGTESIPKVDKITGPGNIFVALAKKAVSGYVGIDSIAGPSEILVLADETANPRYVAADLLSQAEHDEMASAILVTTSEELGRRVSEEVDEFVKGLSRKEIIQKSLDNYGWILLADSLEDAVETVNLIASEHLEIVTRNPFEVMTKIRNAGAIFLGEYSSEPLGDYFAGPNHILPTNGTARFFSPVSVDDFVKKSSIIYYSREALEKAHEDIEYFAKQEQLTAHANSIHVRFEEPGRRHEMDRRATIERNTKETNVSVTLNLDGSGTAQLDTGIGFFDHMLDGFARHGLFDLAISADGDLEVDCHHTIEDTGIVLGKAIKEAVGDKKGIRRYGSCILPMDEALVLCAVDLSGRPYYVSNVEFPSQKIGDMDTEMVREFFYAISYSAEMNLHFQMLSGSNSHHICEAMFKAFAKALDMAVSIDERITGVLSTKGSLE